MESSREPSPERNWNTFRWLAAAAGLWFLGSGVWGLLTETPVERAVAGCEAAAQTQAVPDASVAHTEGSESETAGGWFVAGQVTQYIDSVATVTHRWECTADAEGRNPAISAWIPVS